MPSLMRFLTILAALGAFGFAVAYALATFVTPRTREMTVTIPVSKLKPGEVTSRAPTTSNAQSPGLQIPGPQASSAPETTAR